MTKLTKINARNQVEWIMDAEIVSEPTTEDVFGTRIATVAAVVDFGTYRVQYSAVVTRDGVRVNELSARRFL